jgi:glycosyltransferase involved in cell wall biosynthesis
MYFEYNWARLLLGIPEPDFRWMDENFDLVLSTSWSPTDYAVLGLVAARVSGPMFVQPCNYEEIPKIEAFHPRLHCISSLPCDWINPAFYRPKPYAERTTDIVMVANWGDFKRHWELFHALSKLPRQLKIVLIGQPEGGRDHAFIRRQARDFGVPQELEFHESISIDQVAAHQCNAKVSLILTRREGCCVAAVESLFAGCALAMRQDAHVGPRAYINENTGRLLRPGRIAEDLAALLRDAAGFQSREWAMENRSCHQTHAKLNAILRTHALQRGLPWTRDLVLPHWRPYPTFVHASDQQSMRPVYEELHARYPQVFSQDLWQDSWR